MFIGGIEMKKRYSNTETAVSIFILLVMVVLIFIVDVKEDVKENYIFMNNQTEEIHPNVNFSECPYINEVGLYNLISNESGTYLISPSKKTCEWRIKYKDSEEEA